MNPQQLFSVRDNFAQMLKTYVFLSLGGDECITELGNTWPLLTVFLAILYFSLSLWDFTTTIPTEFENVLHKID